MGANDGKVLKTTKIVSKGPDKDCFNVVLVAEGYKADEQKKFEQDCQTFVNAFNSLSPFNDCSAGVNFHRINVSSTDSGADDPKTCPKGTGVTVKTYLDASFCNNGIRRLMSFDTSLAIKLLNKEVPAWHIALVLVNSTISGGAGGGNIAIASVAGNWTNTGIHEFGHSAFGLADEYPTWYGCPPPPEPSQNYHSGVEPAKPNVTTKKQRHQVKWRHLILPTTPVPTTVNADCTKCDTQPNPLPAGTVGLFEGAHYCHCGAYRPAFHCMMQNLSGFCPVCQSVIRKKLATFAQQADLAITPWGYAQSPPKPPWWQTPDIWGTPVRGQTKNDLHVRVHNKGNKTSPTCKVRLSFVPFTTVIDLANEVLIDEVSRPALAVGGIDHFIVNWDLTPPKLPPKYGKFDHFCVIAQIKTVECNTTNNQAQNNFVNVPVKKGAPPPPLRFEIANPWRREAVARLVLETDVPWLQLEPIDFEPEEIPLGPGERRVVEVALALAEEVAEREAIFEIAQFLDDQLLGGIGGVVSTVVGIRVALGAHPFENPAVREALLHAVPWMELIREVFPDQDVPVAVDLWEVGPVFHDAREVPYDPDRARELLAEAGFPEGFRLHLLFWPEDEQLAIMAEMMTELLATIGIEVLPTPTTPDDAPAQMAEMSSAGISVLWLTR